MFSYTGLSAEQVERLKKEFAIYAVSSGRICMAALNTMNAETEGAGNECAQSDSSVRRYADLYDG